MDDPMAEFQERYKAWQEQMRDPNILFNHIHQVEKYMGLKR